MSDARLIHGDVLEVLATLPDESVHCVTTSPPYWGLRDYGVEGMIGLEPTTKEYVAKMVAVFAEVRRVLRKDGVCWLNLGDSYAHSGACGGSSPDGPRKPRETDRAAQLKMNYHVPPGLKPKDLCGIPWRVAFALQADGWWLRDAVVWHKPNPMPGSQRDRCTSSYEFVFQLTKSATYYFDQEAIKEPAVSDGQTMKMPDGWDTGDGSHGSIHRDGREPGENKGAVVSGRIKRNVWTIPTQSFKGAHFATFPEKLVEPCILSSTSERGCCLECGAPWSRVVERDRQPTRPGRDSKLGDTTALEHGNRDPERNVTSTKTTGWQPTCKCGGEPIPCTVLDPFAGSGTTLAVARKYGRRSIGIELNAEYLKLAEKRLRVAHEEVGLFMPRGAA